MKKNFYRISKKNEVNCKGKELGASGQISKPEVNQLIALPDEIIFGIKQ